MKITARPQTHRATAAGGVGAAASAARAAAPAAAAPVQAPTPTTSLMGIPKEEVTPKVRLAIETLMKEVERLRNEVDEMRRHNGALEKLADEDTLLPVSNRRAFVRELSRSMSFAQRYGQPSSLGFFDVNNMKAINDTLGHSAGDAALLHVAQTLLDNVRHSDVVGRLGGDEFGVVFSQVEEEAAIRKITQLVEQISSNPVRWREQEFNVSIAHGHYTFHGSEDASDALIAADKSMYAQKVSSRS